MKHARKLVVLAAMLAMALPLASSPAGAADIGISINMGQPDYYGPLEVDGYSQPRVYYREPYWVNRRQGRELQPVYLRAPRAHRTNWSRYCRQYNACGRRVYFVQDGWYNDVYAPRYRERHGNEHRGNSRNDNRGHDGHDGRDDHDHEGRNTPDHPGRPGQPGPYDRRTQGSGDEYKGRPIGSGGPYERNTHDDAHR